MRSPAPGPAPWAPTPTFTPAAWCPPCGARSWRSTPSSLRPENLDLTPFAGRPVDGGSHCFTVAINPIGDTWNVMANLFLYTDHGQSRTIGALVSGQVPVAASMSTTVNPPKNGAVKFTQKASRNDVTTGYVNTSAGRVYTTVKTGREWRNAGTASDNGLVQSIKQSDHMSQDSTSRIGNRTIRSSSLEESYPITVDASSAHYTDDQNFSLDATVHRGQEASSVVREGRARTARNWNWTVESDGHSTSSYKGTDDRGRPYIHYIRTDHGKVLVNRQLP